MASLPAPLLLTIGFVLGVGATTWWHHEPAPAHGTKPFSRPTTGATWARNESPGTTGQPGGNSFSTAPGAEQVVISEGGAADWASAWKAAPRPADREHFLQSLLSVMGRSRPDEVRAFLLTLPPTPLRSDALSQSLLLLGETAPQRALALVAETLSGSNADNTRGELLEQWATANPREALTWAAGQSDAATANLGVEGVIAAAAHVDPAQTLELLSTFPALTAEQRLSAQRALVGVWAQSAPQAALVWAKSPANAAAAEELIPITYLNWATNDPAAAAAGLANHDAALLPGVAAALAGLWAQSDPPAAAAWLQAQPEVTDRPAASADIAQSWAQSDPAAALAWARQIPPQDAAHTEALRGVVLQWTRVSPETFNQHLATLPAAAQQEIRALMVPQTAP